MSTSVYIYRDGRGRVLYVGVTDRGVRRLHEHADSKPWWSLAKTCEIEHFDTRREALGREAHLIRTMLPLYNKQLNPVADVDPGWRAAFEDELQGMPLDHIDARALVEQARAAGCDVTELETAMRNAERHDRALSSGERRRFRLIAVSLGVYLRDVS